MVFSEYDIPYYKHIKIYLIQIVDTLIDVLTDNWTDKAKHRCKCAYRTHLLKRICACDWERWMYTQGVVLISIVYSFPNS